MAYCTWDDVVEVYPEASIVETVAENRTALLTEGSELADSYLSGVVALPIDLAYGQEYPALLTKVTALLVADMVSARVQDGQEDQIQADYGGNLFTGTLYGHRAMGHIQAMRQSKAFTEAQVTTVDASRPWIEWTSMANTNGTIEARFQNKRFMDEERHIYTFTITSSGGTVAGDDLTFKVQRDYDEYVYSEASPLAVNGSGWHGIEHGLQVRFIDKSSGADWRQDNSFEITCEPFTSIIQSDGVRGIEVSRG